MIQPAKRLDTVQEYYFSKKLREVRELAAAGKPIINMGIGSPDLLPPSKVINAIQQSFNDAAAHKYQSYQGLPELRNAIAEFYKHKFQVPVNPANEILPLMGSKEGIMHISMAFLNEGDKVLIPNPGYLRVLISRLKKIKKVRFIKSKNYVGELSTHANRNKCVNRDFRKVGCFRKETSNTYCK